jgi:hypothetical protein
MLTTAELQITAVTPSSIPEGVGEYFRASSAVLTLDGEIPLQQFDHLLRIDGMGATTYLGEHEKLLAVGDTERTTYLVDLTSDTDYFKDKPFVGYTRTYSDQLAGDFSHRGYGRRRLHALNLAAQTLYNLPLHSDTVRSAPATRLWENLVADSLAEMYMQGQHTRYKFIQ